MGNQTPDAMQIRAAMAMLNWENDDLAKVADISPSSVHNIKGGLTRPQARVLSAIRAAFESQGLEFIDNSGVRERPEGLEVYNGTEGLCNFMDKVFNHLSTHGGKARVSGVSNDDWIAGLGDYNQVHIDRMNKLVVQKPDVEVLNLSVEGTPENGLYSSYVKYRYLPEQVFEPVPFYIFGESVGIINFQSDPSPKIIIIQSSTVARAFSKQFDFFWKIARTRSHPQERVLR
jgi:hypothetical protein